VELGRRRRHLSSIHRQLPERRCRRIDGSAPQLPETFADHGVSRDDGSAPRRTSPRLETDRQPLSALRSDRESLFAHDAGCNFWRGINLDPFCGCGTTIHAAQKLGRQWIGIDITYLAINLIKRRLKDAFGEEIEFEEKGQPTDFTSAKRLAELDKFQFQHWALSLIGARPLKEGEGKGADRGVDGLLYYYETERKDFLNRVREDAPSVKHEPVHREKIIVQVKGGGVNRGDVATLLGDVENQKAAGGVLITLEKPSKQMRTEAADAGRYASKLWHDKDYPRIQILTVEGLLNSTERIDAPPQINPFAMAARESAREKQTEML